MDQLLTIVLMCIIIYLIIKIGSKLWRFIGMVLLVAAVWFYKDQILLFVQDILNLSPVKTNSEFDHKTTSFIDNIGSIISNLLPFK